MLNLGQHVLDASLLVCHEHHHLGYEQRLELLDALVEEEPR